MNDSIPPKGYHTTRFNVVVMLSAGINRTRQIGCEYEMTVPLIGLGTGSEVQAVLASIFNANHIRAASRGYSRDPVPAHADVVVEHDSSVQGEKRYHGIIWHSIEIKTRILNGMDDWERVVPKVLEIAAYCGARVNASCGHHVHLGLPEVKESLRPVRSLTALVSRVEPVLFGLVSPSRRGNYYCAPIGKPTAASSVGPNGERSSDIGDRLCSRYDALNLTHISAASPHIEFRHHQGTLDANKSRHWLRLLLQVTEHAVTRNCQSHATPLENNRRGFERMATAIGLRVNSKIYRSVSDELAETASFLLRRWRHFNESPAWQPRTLLREQVVEREVA